MPAPSRSSSSSNNNANLSSINENFAALTMVDPFAFLVGAIGATTVGVVGDENQDGEENQVNSTLRSMSAPIRGAIRFFTGGFIYVLLDGVIQKVTGMKLPAAAGAVTALCFADTGNSRRSYIGSVGGMAIFAQLADLIKQGIAKQKM